MSGNLTKHQVSVSLARRDKSSNPDQTSSSNLHATTYATTCSASLPTICLVYASSPIRKKHSAAKDEATLDEMSVRMVRVQIPFLTLIFTIMTDNPIQQPTTARQLSRGAL